MTSARQRIIDYIAPETDPFRAEYGLLFGSRHAQADLVSMAAFLYRHRYFERLIVSGGPTHGIATPEAIEIADLLVDAGIPQCRIISETRAINTGENVEFSRELGLPVDELFLLGKIYGKRRYAMTIRAKWPEIKRVACVGINYFGVPRDHWWENPDLRGRVMSEMRKIPGYVERGFIGDIDVRDRAFVW
jgi:hypothetical protein